MSILRIRLVVFVLALAGVVMSARAATAGSPARPNVLLIVVDDLGFSDIGPYGSEIPTPNLDRLAADGMRFTQFYNCAVCIVTRASLYTGLYPRGGSLRPGMVTLGEAMRQSGYRTILTGKWHLGSEAPRRPIDRGFDEYYGVLTGGCHYFNPAIPDPAFYNEGGITRLFAHNEKIVTKFPADFYTTDAFSSHAVQMIQDAAKSKTPFFLNLCYNAPHFPLHAPAADIARHRGKYRAGYDALRERRFRRQVEMGIMDPANTTLSKFETKTGDFRYDYEITPWNKLDAATRAREEERMEVYAAMVDRLDQGIGRVLKALDDTGAARNTIVIFHSDNGGSARWSSNNAKEMAGFLEYNRGIPVGDGRGYEFVGPGWGWAQNAPFRKYKAWLHEGGMCTPMIVRWPGVVKPGAITRHTGHVMDIMPTLLEAVGGTYPKSMDGKATLPLEGQSLVPIWRGQAPAMRKNPLAWELYGNRAIRDGEWKLVWGASDKRWELYNLATDRSETIDLVTKYPDRAATMASAWEKWAKFTGALR